MLFVSVYCLAFRADAEHIAQAEQKNRTGDRQKLAMLSLLVAASAFPTAPLTPTPLNTTGWSTVMMISAHPDDNESGAGGLTAMLTSAGVNVVYMIVTNGNKGCHPGNAVVDCGPITPPEIASLRKKEAKAAADALGVSELIMLDGYADGMLCSRAIRSHLSP